jgi:hypothetical protein
LIEVKNSNIQEEFKLSPIRQRKKFSVENKLSEILAKRSARHTESAQFCSFGESVSKDVIDDDQYNWKEYEKLVGKIKDLNVKNNREATVIQRAWLRQRSRHFSFAAANVH